MIVPEVRLPERFAAAIAREALARGVERVEQDALAGALNSQGIEDSESLREQLLRAWKEHDHVVVRGVPVGVAEMLLTMALLGARFKPYREARVVKHFRMSPWTRELSHTTREGDFHTDINTAPTQPRVTAIQGVVADPAGPPYGDLRVARLPDIVAHLHAKGDAETLEFLERTKVTMLNDHSQVGWTGNIVSDGEVRYHPETLRAARRRWGTAPAELDDNIARVHAAAMAVSTPIYLAPGDTVVVSNTRALHRRGACSVVFDAYPLDFVTREVHVLHLLDEPS